MAGGVWMSHKQSLGSIRIREWIIEYPRRGPRDKQDLIPSSIHRVDSSERGANACENLNSIMRYNILRFFKHNFVLFAWTLVYFKPDRDLVFL